jgi:hypothetical protein
MKYLKRVFTKMAVISLLPTKVFEKILLRK